MENPMWMASIFGPFLVIVSLWILVLSGKHDQVHDIVQKYPRSFLLMGHHEFAHRPHRTQHL